VRRQEAITGGEPLADQRLGDGLGLVAMAEVRTMPSLASADGSASAATYLSAALRSMATFIVAMSMFPYLLFFHQLPHLRVAHESHDVGTSTAGGPRGRSKYR